MPLRARLLAAPALVVGFALALPASAQTGHSENYQTYCAVCHGDDGKGQTPKGKEKAARKYGTGKGQRPWDDARLEDSVTKGRGKMPAFKDKLSADDIKALVKEVRSFGQK